MLAEDNILSFSKGRLLFLGNRCQFLPSLCQIGLTAVMLAYCGHLCWNVRSFMKAFWLSLWMIMQSVPRALHTERKHAVEKKMYGN